MTGLIMPWAAGMLNSGGRVGGNPTIVNTKLQSLNSIYTNNTFNLVLPSHSEGDLLVSYINWYSGSQWPEKYDAAGWTALINTRVGSATFMIYYKFAEASEIAVSVNGTRGYRVYTVSYNDVYEIRAGAINSTLTPTPFAAGSVPGDQRIWVAVCASYDDDADRPTGVPTGYGTSANWGYNSVGGDGERESGLAVGHKINKVSTETSEAFPFTTNPDSEKSILIAIDG